MEERREPEERDYGGEFVEDEEGGYVGEGRGAEGLEVAVEETGEAGFEAGDAGGFWGGGGGAFEGGFGGFGVFSRECSSDEDP